MPKSPEQSGRMGSAQDEKKTKVAADTATKKAKEIESRIPQGFKKG